MLKAAETPREYSHVAAQRFVMCTAAGSVTTTARAVGWLSTLSSLIQDVRSFHVLVARLLYVCDALYSRKRASHFALGSASPVGLGLASSAFICSIPSA